MYFIGILIFAIIIYIFNFIGARITALNDLPSLLFVLFSYIGIIIITNGFNDFRYGLKVIFGKENPSNKKKLKGSIALFSFLFKSSFLISALGMILGAISLLNKLSDPTSIWPSLAVIILIPLYNIILDLIFIFPIIYKLKKLVYEK